MEILSGDLIKQLCDGIKNTECISLTVDDSTGTTDSVHLMLFLRCYEKPKRDFVDVVACQPSVDKQGSLLCNTGNAE